MKHGICWLLAGLMLLSLGGCGPVAAEKAAAEATSVPSDAPSIVDVPAPSADAPIPTADPTPTAAPTAVPTPLPTDTPAPTATPDPTASPTAAPKSRPLVEIVEEMAVYYARDGERAAEKVHELLSEMAAADPDGAGKWTEIMDRWKTLDERISVNLDVLPDGLPDTDELCIVVLGYSLNANGSMKPHLKNRLKVALRSAQKYPNAYILCTGGGTAARKKSATEAGQMSAWLKKQGVKKQRIIVEKKSHTTAQNARCSLDVLLKDYPQVKYIAVVSGDYHVRVGVMLFEAEIILRDAPITVVSNAGCKTSNKDLSTQYRAGGLIELAGNGKAAHQLYYNRYDMNKYPPLP